VFAGILLVQPDIAEDYGEDRWIGLGIIREATVAVVFTMREPETIRIIFSLR
jgi:uncharacterized protein